MKSKNKKILLGAHTSIEGGVSKAIDLAVQLKFNTIQIFTKNCNQWFAKPLNQDEIDKYKLKLSNSGISPVISHSSYLINLCAKDKSILKKSRNAFLDELLRCEQLGIPYLNFHPGGHLGLGEEEGVKIIAESLNLAYEKSQYHNVKYMLEATAGQGTSIGHKFEQLRSIIDKVEHKEIMCVCIDTAHIFAAGYDLRSPEAYKKTMKEFDDIIGLDFLKCIHINDSKKDLGTRVDRHENIGDGFIGYEGFANIMNDERLEDVPKILETPKSKGQLEDLENIKRLLNLVRRNNRI